jgi:AcrR family transcriptional regulator
MDTAITLVERKGEAALSMRRIAQELDVWPMSLYRYFRDKQALLDALAEAAVEQIALPEPTADWQAQLRQLLEHARRAFAQHPGGGFLRLTGPALLPAAARVTKAGIEILNEAGLESDEAEIAWHVLVDYLAGSAGADNQQFEYGMQLLIDGLRARAASAHPQ